MVGVWVHPTKPQNQLGALVGAGSHQSETPYNSWGSMFAAFDDRCTLIITISQTITGQKQIEFQSHINEKINNRLGQKLSTQLVNF